MITSIIRIHLPGNLNIFNKFHGNSSKGFRDISVKVGSRQTTWQIDVATSGATSLASLKTFCPLQTYAAHFHVHETQILILLLVLHITWLKRFLILLCFPGFVELNHMLTTRYPPLSANSTSGPLRLLQKQRRERERWPSQGHLLLDVLKLWNSERICTSLVSPRTFFSSAHIYTPLSPQNPAWMTATFSGPQKLLLEQWGKKSERNYIRPTYNDQPHWTLKGIWMSKVQQEQNKLFKNWIEDCNRRSFYEMVWVWGNWLLKTNL